MSDYHGSEDGVPPEVAAKDVCEAAREAARIIFEKKYREREKKHLEEEATFADRNGYSVEVIEDTFPHCLLPTKYTDLENQSWEDTCALVKLSRHTGVKVPVKIPSDIDKKWNKAQKLFWALAKTEVEKVQRRIDAVKWRADTRKVSKVVNIGKGKEGHTKDPEAVARAGEKNAHDPITSTVHNE